ncbi:MAG: M42 family metallopeptidase [Acutalibacteraceae bacterium]
MKVLETLKNLCKIDGTSGREEDVRAFIINKIKGKCEYQVDPMGNVLVFKKGQKKPKNKVLLTAHMDEVGFIVTYITEEGFLKFDCVGGIDSKVIVGRRVCFSQSEKKIFGVIGIKPVHMTEPGELGKVPPVSQLYIDIGAKSKEEAEQYVSIGDSAYFVCEPIAFGENKLRAKAIDDRFGCSVLLDMIDQELEYDAHFAFLVQEEVGLRGSQAAAFTVAPDYAIVLEATTAADVAGVSGSDRVCCLGKGAVVSFMDRTTVYDRELFKRAFEIGKQKGIACQTKTMVAGGNDAGSIHKSRGGVKTITVSLPCRYIHSACCVADISDMSACKKLAEELFKEFANA